MHIVQRGINRELGFFAEEDCQCYLHWLDDAARACSWRRDVFAGEGAIALWAPWAAGVLLLALAWLARTFWRRLVPRGRKVSAADTVSIRDLWNKAHGYV